MDNPCIECGKQRIEGRSWKEKVGSGEITHTQTVCPDPACQKIVDKILAEREAKSALLLQNRLKNHNRPKKAN